LLLATDAADLLSGATLDHSTASSTVLLWGLVTSRILPLWASMICSGIALVVHEREVFFWKQVLHSVDCDEPVELCAV